MLPALEVSVRKLFSVGNAMFNYVLPRAATRISLVGVGAKLWVRAMSVKRRAMNKIEHVL